MEVEVLEITRSNLQQLGIEYPTSATVSSPTKLTLGNINQLGKGDFSVTPFGLTADFLKQVGRANTLASPRIRARNREKAKILIGQREPVITNSVTPTAGGTAVVTGSVQYLDVGLTLEVEPTVHLDNEVSIKLNLEVSSILKQVQTGGNSGNGTIAYEIGTRNAQTLLTLKDGETQVLAGLIQDSDTRSSAHIPGLGDIPILGKLFGSDRTNKEKSEIVLSITPRIIRSSARPSSETTEFWYGTESNLRSAPLGSQSSSGAGNHDVPPAPGVPATPISGALPPSGVLSAPPELPAPPRARVQSEPNPEEPNLTWTGPTNATIGQSFDVGVDLSSPLPLSKIVSQLHFDGSILQLDSVDAGALIPADLQSASPPKINQHAGVVQYVVALPKESPLQGEGSLLVLHFKALGPAASTPVTLQFVATGPDGRSIHAGVPAPLNVNIGP